MQRIYYSLLGMLAISTLQAQPVNNDISNSPFFDGEPYIALNPSAPQNMIVAWMSYVVGKGTAIKYVSTTNNGKSWSVIGQMPHFASTYHAADVSMAWSKNDTVYMSYIDYRQSPDSGGIYVLKSINSGTGWNNPVKVWDMYEDGNKRPIDRPWLEVDRSNTASAGHLYMSTKPAPWIPAPNRPYLKTAAHSSSWTNFKYIDTTGHLVGNVIQAPMATLAVSANGTLFALYPSYLPSQSPYARYILASSKNQGVSFNYYNAVVNPTAVQDTNYKLGTKLVCNPNNSNQLAFAFVDNRNGDPDIFVTSSNDEGITWSTPIRVNDDAIGNGKAQDLVWLTYSNNGKLIASWRDRRNGSGSGFSQPSDVYFSFSNDNGSTFSKNGRLSDITAPHDPVLSQSGNDFMSTCAYNDTLYATWGDVRSGKINIYFAKTDINTATSSIQILSSENAFSTLQLFPNPAQTIVNGEFYLPEPIKYTIYIFDLNGKEVYKQYRSANSSGFIKEPINTEFLPNGEYLFQLKYQGNTCSSKFLIAR